MCNRAHPFLQALCSGAIIAGLVVSPGISMAAQSVKMGRDGVKKEVEWSNTVAGAISLLNKCGRPDLARRFLQIQDEMLLLCGATDRQKAKIKRPLQKKHNFSDSSMLNAAVGAVKNTIKERANYVSNIKVIIPATKDTFTCD
jgi:hypothetical protein